MKENKVIVGIGEALWDMLPEGKKIGGAVRLEELRSKCRG